MTGYRHCSCRRLKMRIHDNWKKNTEFAPMLRHARANPARAGVRDHPRIADAPTDAKHAANFAPAQNRRKWSKDRNSPALASPRRRAALDVRARATIVSCTMAIRFPCGSCGQPIEVDDEWASKAVACPYCRKTVTAPAESTLTDLAEIPTAAPVRSDEPVAHPGTFAATEQVTIDASHRVIADQPNRIASVALVLVLAVVVQAILLAVLLSSHTAALEKLQERIVALQEEGAGFIAAHQQATGEFYEAHGGAPPTWLILSAVLQLAGGITWIAAVVCAVIGLTRKHRRRRALAALLIAVGSMLTFCCGGLVFG